jgi:hypothetical protein
MEAVNLDDYYTCLSVLNGRAALGSRNGVCLLNMVGQQSKEKICTNETTVLQWSQSGLLACGNGSVMEIYDGDTITF